jgi:hypothetical protein
MNSDELNAALAARLAPLFGETAVYAPHSGWWCEQHGFWRDRIDVRGITADGCPACLQPMTPATERQPRDFTDPAVLWPLWERWDVKHDWTITLYRALPDGFEASVWQDLPAHYRTGASVAEAVARAWLAVLERWDPRPDRKEVRETGA